MDLKSLLKTSVERKASDLHVAPNMPPILRINGDLVQLEDAGYLNPEQAKEIIYSCMDESQRAEFEQSLELDFAVNVVGLAGFRVNAFYQAEGIGAAFRVIPQDIPTLEQLDLPPVFKQLLNLPNGLILVTGPTGSGKSTTLAAMLNHINVHQSVHIITIEDPIEYTHKSQKSLINQRQVHRDTHSFASALRSALREDPDVILLGEMRDLETIRLALTAAETGHLVMATLHTSSAPRSVSRIIDVFPAGEKNIIRNMLSESLQAVICQTLLKSTSGSRVAAFEIMLGTPAIRNLIRDDKIAQMYSTIQTSSRLGMCTLEQSIQSLVAKQVLSPDMAREVNMNQEIFHDV